MPNRLIREGILTSERVNKLGWHAEVFYRRLMSVVDDFGRYYATPMLLRAACYPLHLDKVSDADIGKWLTECVTAALVSVYPAQDGKRYLQMHDFRQQVRAQASKFPQKQDGCIADAARVRSKCVADAHLVGDVVEDVVEDVNAASAAIAPSGAKPPARRAASITFDGSAFCGIAESDWAAWAAAYPAVDCRAEVLRAALWLKENPTKRKKNNGRFITNWLARKQERGGERVRPAVATSATKAGSEKRDYTGDLQ